VTKARSLVLTGLFLTVAPVFGAVTIDNITPWNGSTAQSVFGIGNTQTYGQVITVPTGSSRLQSFAFEVRLQTTLAFRAEVYAWDGNKATGPALFEGPVTSTTSGAVYQLITVNTGNLPVTSGAKYVLFLSSSKDNAGHSGLGIFGSPVGDLYSGGTFVFLNNGTDTTLWTSTNWEVRTDTDLAFSATFDDPPPPPPPGSPAGAPSLGEWGMIFLGSGLMVVAFRFLQKQRGTV